MEVGPEGELSQTRSPFAARALRSSIPGSAQGSVGSDVNRILCALSREPGKRPVPRVISLVLRRRVRKRRVISTDDDCIEFARECARLARLCPDDKIREQLLEMARLWMSVAMHEMKAEQENEQEKMLTPK